MKRGTLKTISVILLITLVMTPALQTNAAEMYHFSELRKETPQDFNDFLSACTLEERIQLLQALQDLPKLRDEYFGRLKGLPSLENFVTDKKKATMAKPLKPSTFNEVLPETVVDAINQGIIKEVAISPEAIRKALVWRAYNKTTYLFRGDKEIDYHGIVQWAASKAEVEAKQVENLPTFTLEQKIAEKYFEKLWDSLTPEQKKAVLDNVEKETGKMIPDKSSIAYMGGAAALAALSATINIMGFAFYVLLTSTIHAVAALLGITLPWIVYQTATTWAAVLGGPIGWTISAVLGVIGLTFLGSAEKDTVSAFIMTVNMIKAHRWANAQ